MQSFEQVSDFHTAHGTESGQSVTGVSLEDGDLWLAEVDVHRWGISFYPHRSDHPDAPVVHVQVGEEDLGGGADADAAEAWARERFEGRDPREFVLVDLEEGADDRDVELVEALFDRAGAPAIVRRSIVRRSAELLPWIIVLKVAAAGFAGKAGADLWDAVRGLVRDLYRARQGSTGRDGSVMLEDEQRSIVLASDLPDEAYAALEGLPAKGYFLWDASEQRWRAY